MKMEPAKKERTERGIILFWGAEKRIIAHSDLLRRLFEGVIPSPLEPQSDRA